MGFALAIMQGQVTYQVRNRSAWFWTPRIIALYIAYRIASFLLSKLRVSQLTRRSVLITGCDSGFGLLTTHRLSRKGVKVFAACLTEEGVQKLSKSPNVTPFLMDVTSPESVQKGFEFIQPKCPNGLWGVINNAGVLRSGALEIMPISHWQLQMYVNVMGIAIVTRTFFPLLLKAKGRVVNIASVAGRLGTPGTSGYNASKFAVEGLSDAWRREFKLWGIKVIIIEPGIMKTPLWDVPMKEAEFDGLWNSLNEEQKARYGRDFFLDAEKKSKELIQKLGGNPAQVVNALDNAVTSKYPKTRYVVGSDAVIWIGLSYLPVPVADFFLSKLMKSATPACFKKK